MNKNNIVRKILFVLAAHIMAITCMAKDIPANPPTTIVGPASVYFGFQYVYKLSNSSGGLEVDWIVPCGTIVTNYGDSILVLFDQPGEDCIDNPSNKVTVFVGSTKIQKVVVITIMPLHPGDMITGNQTIDYNTVAAKLKCTPSQGGNWPNRFYQWQFSLNNTLFLDIDLETADSLVFDEAITEKTWFRRRVVCGNDTAYADTVYVDINVPFGGGTITSGNQTIQVNTAPAQITATAMTSCSATPTSYKWEISADNYSFSTIPNTNTQNLTYSVTLSQDRYFRRRANCGTDFKYTNSILVKVIIPPSGPPPVTTIDSILTVAGINLSTLLNIPGDSLANQRRPQYTQLATADSVGRMAQRLSPAGYGVMDSIAFANLDTMALHDNNEQRITNLGPTSQIVDSTRVFVPYLDDNAVQLYRSTGNYRGLDSLIDLTTHTSFEELATRVGDSLIQSSVPSNQRIAPLIYDLLGYTRSVVINGPSLVATGQTEHYEATFNYAVGSPSNIKWEVTGGDIVSQNINPASGAIYINITWKYPYGSPHVGIVDVPSRQYGILDVAMYSTACNAYPVTQDVYYGQVPSILTTSSCPSTMGGTATYQWQMMDVYSGSNWADISGATSATYQPPAFTSVWRMYRRLTKVTILGSIVQTRATTAVSIKLMTLDGGRISATTYDIAYNTSPITVSQIAASGGYTTPGYAYSYAWEYSVNNGSWTQFGTGASFPTLNIQSSNTRVRRKTVITGINTSGLAIEYWTAYSNEITFSVYYQSADYENLNYMRENLVLTRGITTWEDADQLTIDKKIQSTTYFDGLSRPIQIVDKGDHYDDQTSQWWDMVQMISYEAGGRIEKSFLPYPTTDNIGKFKTNAATVQPAYYYTKFSDNNAFAKIEYDGDPFNQVKKTFAPGNSWAGNNKSVTTEIIPFVSTDNVRRWKIGYTSGDKPVTTGLYSDQSLIKAKGLDENGNEIFTYVTRDGLLIAKKVQYNIGKHFECGPTDYDCKDHNNYLTTYYVYDDWGQLRFIITPKAVGEMMFAGTPWVITQTIADELCFQYEYDELGRTIINKTPGKSTEYFVYDKRNRIVFTQDGNQRSISPTAEWHITLYDDLNRTVATGLYKTNKTRDQLQSDAETASGLVTVNTSNGGNINIWDCPIPTADINTTSVFTQLGFSYYDNYSYTGVKTINASVQLSYQGGNVESRDQSSRIKGMSTGSKIKILDNGVSGLPSYLISTIYYDEEGRGIQTLGDNIKTGIDVSSSQYHFDGRILSDLSIHSATGTSYSNFPILTKYKYDKIGRLVGIAKKIDNTNRSYVTSTSIPGSTEDDDANYKTTVTYKYNELGQRIKKILSPQYNSGLGLETIDYSYNIRGWLTGINKNYALGEYTSNQWDHYFGMYIGYDNSDSKFAAAQYNGNITGVLWKSQGDNTPRKFDYEYDGAGRLINAGFSQRGNSSESWNHTKYDFSSGMDYDHNGNISVMIQRAVLPGNATPVTIDQLVYTYASSSNKLTKVADGGGSSGDGKLGDFKDGSNGSNDDYVYDNNGNIVTDKNRDIQNGGSAGIIYNYMNKVSLITIQNKGTIKYVYDASGAKLQKIVTDNTQVAGGGQTRITTTTYIGEYIYEQVTIGASAGATELQSISHEEGRIRVITPYYNASDPANFIGGGISLPNSKQGVFDYFITDHLDNVRVSITEEINKASDVCTMETASSTHEEAVFGNPTNNEVNATRFSRVTSGWTTGANGSDKVSKLVSPGSNAAHIGPNALLRVMAGDIISAKADYYYVNNPGSSGGNGNGLAGFTQALGNALTGSKATQLAKDNVSSITSSLSSTGPLQTFMNNQPTSGNTATPRAYLNYIFLDEQFNYVGETSGFDRVDYNGSNTPSPTVLMNNIKATKNGYVYIYLSNESTEPVYFDNFSVSQERGQLLQEDHYYAFGLRIAGISSKALSSSFNTKMISYGYQGSFSEELTDFDLNYDEFLLRTYDPQIGRWINADPFDEFPSPYLGMGNNPISTVDPDGGSVWSILDATSTMVGMGAGLLVGVYMAAKTDNPLWVPGMMVGGAILGAGIGYATINTASFAIGLTNSRLLAPKNSQVYYKYGNFDVSDIKTKNPKIWEDIKLEWGEISGLGFHVNDRGILGYSRIRTVGTEGEGKPAVDKSHYSSEYARQMIIEIIEKGQYTSIVDDPGAGNHVKKASRNVIHCDYLERDNIQSHLTDNLDKRTLNMGMIMLHEWGHTNAGGRHDDYLTDLRGRPIDGKDEGFNEKFYNYNKIRRQMSRYSRLSWGRRKTYFFYLIAGNNYMAMSRKAKKIILKAYYTRARSIKFVKRAKYIKY